MERNEVCNKGKRDNSYGLDGIGLTEAGNSGSQVKGTK